MKKVGIVSCYFQPNYGSMIQALATQMALDKLGYENETINIAGFNGEIKKAKLLYFTKAALTSDILLSKMGMARNVIKKRLSRNKYGKNSAIRKKRFSEFSQRMFRLSVPANSKDELGLYAADHYSTVLVGSDQLWLPGNIAADYYTLNWVPESVNTVAYATSFGQSVLPRDSAAKAAVFLKKIKHIGVREESGQKLVKQIAGRDVPVVCDPTLLFTGEEWMTIQQEEPIIKEPYIFVYFLGNNPPHRAFVKRLKDETGCKIVALVNASYVCTDSFHCSVFSMQYEKIFFSFRRYARKTASSTNSRLDTLFKLAGVKDRILSGDEDVKEWLAREIDYKTVQSNLESIRAQSYGYLKAALADERNTDL